MLAACGGRSDIAAEPAVAPIDVAPHIKGTVDGLLFNATASVKGDLYPENQRAYLSAQLTDGSEGSNPSQWDVIRLQALQGKYECGSGGQRSTLQIRLFNAATNVRSGTDAGAAGVGKCEVFVDAVSATEISGRFNATLVSRDDGVTTFTVKDGTFRTPLTEQAP